MEDNRELEELQRFPRLQRACCDLLKVECHVALPFSWLCEPGCPHMGSSSWKIPRRLCIVIVKLWWQLEVSLAKQLVEPQD